MKRIVNALDKSEWGKQAYAVITLLVTTAIVLPAQTFTTLHSFNGMDGWGSEGVLVQATDGNLYGTTWEGGINCTGQGGCGTVFKIAPSGTLTTLYSFCSQSGCTDGSGPSAAVVQGTDGNLYGTTAGGGANGQGTVFKITLSGMLTTLYSFCSQNACPGGNGPLTALVQATNGDFYGTTVLGGANFSGSVFRITPGGALTAIYDFCSQGDCTGLQYPSGLIQATDGDLYGTTGGSGAAGSYGTVFKITRNSTFTTLYRFCSQSGCPDGSEPLNGVIQATNGDLYGTTTLGGANNQGTVFRITPGGTLKKLYNFCPQSGCTDGSFANGLIQATDGQFYGTTFYGGANNQGTIFKVTPGGTLTTLYSFCSQSGCPNGQYPYVGLTQNTDGKIYGTTSSGGLNCSPFGCGTVFSLSVGLGPFVETQTASGKVGAVVKILGSDLTGASSVSFNGAGAVFEVVSSSEITATVPAEATSGRLKVVTPRRTLSSNVPFRVRP